MFKENWKSCFFCVPGQRASAEQNFEIRQSSVMSSLWLWQLFPTSNQSHNGPSFGWSYNLWSWTTYSPTFFLPGPHAQPTGDVRGKIIILSGGPAAFLQMLALFNYRLLWGRYFPTRRKLPAPTGRLVLTGAISSKFLSIFHTYFLSTFKLGIINLWFMNSLKLKKSCVYIFMFF